MTEDRYLDLDTILGTVCLFWFIFTGNRIVLLISILFLWADWFCKIFRKQNPFKIKIKEKEDEEED